MNDKMASDSCVIDREFGLEQSGYDEDLYIWALRRFAKENMFFLKNINEAIGLGDTNLARRLAHSLKGVSGSLGAMQLHMAARAVEDAFLNDCFSDSKMRDLEAAFNAVFEELEPLLAESPVSINTTSDLDKKKALLLIAELAPLLQSCNSRCFEYLTQIKEILMPVGDECVILLEQIENCDFSHAFTTLTNIGKNIKE